MRLFFATILLLLARPAAADHTPITPQELADLSEYMTIFASDCPQVKSSHFLKESAYGTWIRVICGPRGEAEIYEGTAYRLLIYPHGDVAIVPCRTFSCMEDD